MGFWDNVSDILNASLEFKQRYEHGQRVMNLALGDHGVTGQLNKTGDVGAFEVNLSPSGTFFFQLTQPTLWADFDLYLVNASGNLIASDTTQNNPSQLTVTGSGKCYVFVKSAQGSGQFSLMLKRL